jgi:hypothetical protein
VKDLHDFVSYAKKSAEDEEEYPDKMDEDCGVRENFVGHVIL